MGQGLFTLQTFWRHSWHVEGWRWKPFTALLQQSSGGQLTFEGQMNISHLKVDRRFKKIIIFRDQSGWNHPRDRMMSRLQPFGCWDGSHMAPWSGGQKVSLHWKGEGKIYNLKLTRVIKTSGCLQGQSIHWSWSGASMQTFRYQCNCFVYIWESLNKQNKIK